MHVFQKKHRTTIILVLEDVDGQFEKPLLYFHDNAFGLGCPTLEEDETTSKRYRGICQNIDRKLVHAKLKILYSCKKPLYMVFSNVPSSFSFLYYFRPSFLAQCLACILPRFLPLFLHSPFLPPLPLWPPLSAAFWRLPAA